VTASQSRLVRIAGRSCVRGKHERGANDAAEVVGVVRRADNCKFRI